MTPSLALPPDETSNVVGEVVVGGWVCGWMVGWVRGEVGWGGREHRYEMSIFIRRNPKTSLWLNWRNQKRDNTWKVNEATTQINWAWRKSKNKWKRRKTMRAFELSSNLYELIKKYGNTWKHNEILFLHLKKEFASEIIVCRWKYSLPVKSKFAGESRTYKYL